MSKPTNGKSPTGPLRMTAGTSRPSTNGAARTTAGAGKTATVPGTGIKKPSSMPLAARPVGRGSLREVRDTTAPRAGGKSTTRRQQESRQEQIRKLAPLFGVLGIVVAAIVLFVVLANNNTTAPANSATTAKVIAATTGVKADVFDKVKTGGIANPFQKIPNGPPYVNAKGLPVVLYVGGQFCPYCAAERWSLVSAFSRFGTFSGLSLISSKESNISTFDFSKSTYTSKYVDLQAMEVLDQDSQPLAKLNAEQQQVFDTYDGPPYAQSKAGVPFISYGNKFVTISSGYSPTEITDLSWDTIAGTFTDSTNPTALKILGNANYITAAVCTLTKDQPSNVCSTATIQDIEKTINK